MGTGCVNSKTDLALSPSAAISSPQPAPDTTVSREPVGQTPGPPVTYSLSNRTVSERVINPGPPVKGAVLYRMSPDRSRIAYICEDEDKAFVVVDGVEGKKYDEIDKSIVKVVFSPDSSRVAYSAREGDRWVTVVDGVESEKYDRTCFVTFSPDSQRVTYVATEGNKQFIVVDGVEGKK
jgi:hypothetical protein